MTGPAYLLLTRWILEYKFLQIGLGGVAEFAYLACPDWRCHLHDKIDRHRPPTALLELAPWRGVLIDAHPVAFSQTYTSVHKDLPSAVENLEWILAAVYQEDVGLLPFTAPPEMQRHKGWAHVTDVDERYKVTTYPDRWDEQRFHVATITPMMLIEHMGEPDFIIMDLEGAEVLILQEFLRLGLNVTAYHVETHTAEGRDQVVRDLIAHGYEITMQAKVFTKGTEIQAVKRGIS